MSELKISPLLVGDNNKGEYISSEKLEKDEGEACINEQSVPDKTNHIVRDCIFSQLNKRSFLLEEKSDGEDIKERRSKRLKLFSRCKNQNMRR